MSYIQILKACLGSCVLSSEKQGYFQKPMNKNNLLFTRFFSCSNLVALLNRRQQSSNYRRKNLVNNSLSLALGFQTPSKNCEKRLLASSCLAVQLFSWNNSAPTGRIFMKILFEDFSKFCLENSSFFKIGQDQRVLYTKTNIHFRSYLAQFFSESKMFQTKVLEKIEKNFLCLITIFFFRKSRRLRDNVEKCTAGKATDYNMAYAHCMLDI